MHCISIRFACFNGVHLRLGSRAPTANGARRPNESSSSVLFSILFGFRCAFFVCVCVVLFVLISPTAAASAHPLWLLALPRVFKQQQTPLPHRNCSSPNAQPCPLSECCGGTFAVSAAVSPGIRAAESCSSSSKEPQQVRHMAKRKIMLLIIFFIGAARFSSGHWYWQISRTIHSRTHICEYFVR